MDCLDNPPWIGAFLVHNDHYAAHRMAGTPTVRVCAQRFLTGCRLLEHFQDLQIRPQTDRLQILELLHDLMFQHRAALKDLGKEFIVGVTDLVSGEKDPRNLMIIFSVLKAVMVEWDISDHAKVCLLLIILHSYHLHSVAIVRICL